MNKNKFYTKGDPEETTQRMNQVHTITMFCPLVDESMAILRENLSNLLPDYETMDNLWKGVPTIDALNVFILTTKFCTENNINIDVLSVVAGSLKSFSKLKYINFKFSMDPQVYISYRNMLSDKKSIDQVKNIYHLETLELNLMDMFSQDIIDFINKVMAMNEIISNSVLERNWIVEFTFDEYISFMNMFLGNNGPALHRMNENICDYLRTFPEMIVQQKPTIRFITNYREL